jgi:hypothetical protein
MVLPRRSNGIKIILVVRDGKNMEKSYAAIYHNLEENHCIGGFLVEGT